MLTPAARAVVQSLIALLMTLVRAVEAAHGNDPAHAAAIARLTRLVDNIRTRLEAELVTETLDAIPDATLEPASFAPATTPVAPRRQTRVPRPTAHRRRTGPVQKPRRTRTPIRHSLSTP